ncbi:hypothetical protein IMSAG249_01958 [Lachnospiraceae bacterium]|nr:hypothetical protein IMSAG249_01958 [Lachnospiraceae bacterium]
MITKEKRFRKGFISYSGNWSIKSPMHKAVFSTLSWASITTFLRFRVDAAAFARIWLVSGFFTVSSRLAFQSK